MIKISPKSSKPTFFSFGVLPFIVGGFTDSINPCALTTLAFFTISLFFFLPHRKVVVIFGGCFILGLWGTIFLLTMGLADPVRSSPVFFLACRIIYLVMALIALGLGILNLRDWWIFKKRKSMDSAMKFPVISKRLDQMILKISSDWKNTLWFSFGCAAAGISTAFVMSIYPEQTYISRAVYTLNVQQQSTTAIVSLFLYSLCFVFPLVFSLMFVALSSPSKDFLTILPRHRPAIKMICSAVFFAIGLGLLHVFL